MPTPIADLIKSYSGPPAPTEGLGVNPQAYATQHTSAEIGQMQKAGALIPIDKYIDIYSGHYTKAEDINNQLALKGVDLQVAKEKQAQEDYRTKPLSAEDSDVAAKATQAWGTLDELNQYYQTANKSNGNLVAGPAGGVSLVKAYNASAWAPNDVKALNVMRHTAQASLATALVGMTAGKEGATGPMEMMDNLLPQYSDTPTQWNNKQGILQDMLANRIGPWFQSRAANNKQGNPMYDVSSVKDLLSPIISRYQKIQQNQASNETPSSSFLPPNDRAKMQLFKQATQGTQPQPNATPQPAPGQPQSVASPTPPRQPLSPWSSLQSE